MGNWTERQGTREEGRGEGKGKAREGRDVRLLNCQVDDGVTADPSIALVILTFSHAD